MVFGSFDNGNDSGGTPPSAEGAALNYPSRYHNHLVSRVFRRLALKHWLTDLGHHICLNRQSHVSPATSTGIPIEEA